jgi:hypothetical protein
VFEFINLSNVKIESQNPQKFIFEKLLKYFTCNAEFAAVELKDENVEDLFIDSYLIVIFGSDVNESSYQKLYEFNSNIVMLFTDKINYETCVQRIKDHINKHINDKIKCNYIFFALTVYFFY